APLSNEARPARAAAIEVLLNFLLGDREPRRASRDDAAESRSVTFAEGRHGKKPSERVACHAVLRFPRRGPPEIGVELLGRHDENALAAALELEPRERQPGMTLDQSLRLGADLDDQ